MLPALVSTVAGEFRPMIVNARSFAPCAVGAAAPSLTPNTPDSDRDEPNVVADAIRKMRFGRSSGVKVVDGLNVPGPCETDVTTASGEVSAMPARDPTLPGWLASSTLVAEAATRARSRLVRLTATAPVAWCDDANGSYEAAGRACNVNGDRNTEAATRLMVLAGTLVLEPIRTLAPSWPAPVTGAIDADGPPETAGAVGLVDVIDRATADGADVARDTSGRASGDASASVGNDTG